MASEKEQREHNSSVEHATKAVTVSSGARWAATVVVGLLLTLGIVLRWYPVEGFQGVAFDEHCYRLYVQTLSEKGLGYYPAMVREFAVYHAKIPVEVIPAPTRVTFLVTAHFLKLVTRTEPLVALHGTAAFYSTLMLLLAFGWAYRMGGKRLAVAATMLLALNPLQLHLAQRAFVDSTVACGSVAVLWLLWESTYGGRRSWQLWALTLAAVFLMWTKENSFFVLVPAAIIAVLAAPPARRRALVVTTLAAGLVGGIGLIMFCGGPSTLFTVLRQWATKATALPFMQQYCDGPWYGYWVDMIVINPVLTALAFGALLDRRCHEGGKSMLVVFLALSFLLLASVPYGKDIRFACIWDAPLAILVCEYVWCWWSTSRRLGPTGCWGFWMAIAIISAVELSQFWRIFIAHEVNDPVLEGLLRAVRLLKIPGVDWSP